MKLTAIHGLDSAGQEWQRDLGGECRVTVIAGRMLVVRPDQSMFFVDSEGHTEETRLMGHVHVDDGS